MVRRVNSSADFGEEIVDSVSVVVDKEQAALHELILSWQDVAAASNLDECFVVFHVVNLTFELVSLLDYAVVVVDVEKLSLLSLVLVVHWHR